MSLEDCKRPAHAGQRWLVLSIAWLALATPAHAGYGPNGPFSFGAVINDSVVVNAPFHCHWALFSADSTPAEIRLRFPPGVSWVAGDTILNCSQPCGGSLTAVMSRARPATIRLDARVEHVDGSADLGHVDLEVRPGLKGTSVAEITRLWPGQSRAVWAAGGWLPVGTRNGVSQDVIASRGRKPVVRHMEDAEDTSGVIHQAVEVPVIVVIDEHGAAVGAVRDAGNPGRWPDGVYKSAIDCARYRWKFAAAEADHRQYADWLHVKVRVRPSPLRK